MAVVGGNGPSASGTTIFSFLAVQPPLRYPPSGNTPWADIAAGSGDTGGHVNAHAFRYYRIYCTDGVQHWGAAEIELAVYPSGPDTTLGVTVTSSTNFSGQPASNAIDDNSATEFASDFVTSAQQWVVLDYGATAGNWVAANELRIRCPSAINHGISAFVWQGSDNNSTWTDLFTATVAPVWQANETKTFVATAGGSTSINGTLANTLGALTLSSNATLKINGTLAKTLGNITVTDTANLLIKGSLSKTLGTLVLSSVGAHGTITGTLSKTLASSTLTSNANLLIKGSLSKILSNVTLVSTDNLLIKGSVSKTLDSLTCSSTGLSILPALHAVCSIQLGIVSFVGSGKLGPAVSTSLRHKGPLGEPINTYKAHKYIRNGNGYWTK